MKIATWNINSIRARERRLVEWLAANAPDVLCLQELKVEEAEYPRVVVEAAGYRSVVLGQRTYNGVAILSRKEPSEVRLGLPGDEQARLVSARIDGVDVICAYFPNGGKIGSDKYAYKLSWMKKLRAHLDATFDPNGEVALCGDFNVAPEPIDWAAGMGWEQGVLACPEVREALRDVQGFGLGDAFRKIHPDLGVFSWWDYRMLSFPKNNGLRIDHVYVTPRLMERVVGASIDREERKKKAWDPKGKSSASDHVPVTIELTPR